MLLLLFRGTHGPAPVPVVRGSAVGRNNIQQALRIQPAQAVRTNVQTRKR